MLHSESRNRWKENGRRRLVSLSVLILLCATLWAASDRITIADKVEVAGNLLKLGEIAEIESQDPALADLSLGYAPYPGHYRWLEKTDVLHYLNKQGVDPASLIVNMPDRVLVTRKSRPVEEAEIRAAAESFLQAALPWLEFSIVSIDLPRDVLVPAGDLEIRISSPGQIGNLEHVTLKAEFLVNGESQKNQWLRLQLTAYADVVVTARELGYGLKLSETDLSLERRQITRVGELLVSRQEAIGQETRRALKNGEILSRRDLKSPLLVKRGDTVTMLVKGQSFTVKSSGKARDNGSLGDPVQIQNLESKQNISAIVIGDRKVEVRLP